MKQRSRLNAHGDDLIGINMNGGKRSDDEGTDIQLHKMKPQEHYIEAQVQEGDTLQAIALRFHCAISELKRINHIHKDNEIFARRTVKVPVTPYSILTEMLPTPHLQSVPSTSNHVPSSSTQLLQNNNVLPRNTEPKDDFAINCNEVVLNSTLAPAVVPYTDTEHTEHVSEDTKLLPNKERIAVETVVVKQLTSQGADFGIKWYHLLCCVLVLGVVTPIIYVLFYLDKHEHSDIPPLYSP